MSRCALEKTDEYKKLIFDNTRAILNLAPEELKPKEGRDICVCSFDADVETPFIDIRFGPEDEKEGHPLIPEAEKIFVELFTRHGKIAYRRGSFGFAHANITPIEPKI